MRTSDHSFLISVYYVGLQLFLIFFLRQLWLQAFPPFCFPDFDTDPKFIPPLGFRTGGAAA